MHRRIWQDVGPDILDDDVRRLAASIGAPPVIARLLCQRGLSDPDAARAFLSPDLKQLHDPYLLTGMREAVERMRGAIARQERIIIHGDYDVDGITSTVILRRVLELLGGVVDHFVPDRFLDGYGLQPSTIERLHASGAVLIISVDCGIRAAEAALRARELGVDLIITDHHEPDAALPLALAVINPKRADCSYPDKNLAGVGVALKVVQALLQDDPRAGDLLPHFVKIAALGTMADVVPLVGENRVIARFGLRSLTKGPHAAGLEALLEECGLVGKRLDSFHVGFVVAPRINAAGRMGSANLALDLLLMRGRDGESRGRAKELAQQLSAENTKRQEQDAAILTEARRIVDGDPDVGAQNMLVVAGDRWHRGVLGIVASKLVEHYCKPAIVLGIDNGVANGSGRSIPAFDLLGALESCADIFLKFGGHKQAAGVTIEAGRIGELRRRLATWANDKLGPNDLVPRLRIDAPLGLREISGEVIAGLEQMGPFGMANAKPVFRASPVELMEAPRKIKERHLALLLRQDGRAFRAMAWRASERAEYLAANRFGLELAYSLDRNEYRGEAVTELTVADVRMPSGGPA